ncbi:MAG: hypothetical protein V1838_02030 [Patescibacteria group bacterium]
MILSLLIFIYSADHCIWGAFARPIWLGVPLILLSISAIVFLLLSKIHVSNDHANDINRKVK